MEIGRRMGFIGRAGRAAPVAARTAKNTPWICSGPPHLLGPWGRPVGRGEWPPRTATFRPATFFPRSKKGPGAQKRKRRLAAPRQSGSLLPALLDLRFLEHDVLLRLRI